MFMNNEGTTADLCCSSQRETEEVKYQLHTLQQEQKRYQQTITGLERDISYLKDEMGDREMIIQDKVCSSLV
jgi:FtsZ-binding cell division protein ZapB